MEVKKWAKTTEDFPSLRHLRKYSGKRNYCPPNIPWEITGDNNFKLKISDIDRMISRYGAETSIVDAISRYHAELRACHPDKLVAKNRPLGEDRPKGTEEVSESDSNGSDDAATHGGDGNSGEVNAQAKTSSKNEREGTTVSSDESAAPSVDSDSDSHEESAQVTDDAEKTDGLGEHGEDSLAQTEIPDDGPTDADTPPSEMEERDRATEPETDRDSAMDTEGQNSPLSDGDSRSPVGDDSDDKTDDGDGTHYSPSPSSNYGGNHLPPTKKSLLNTRDARDCKKWMEKIFKSMQAGVFGDDSPRIQPKKIAREMVSRRWNLNRCRRQEMEEKFILILVDVSGSCSSECEETSAAAAAITREMPNVGYITHSNGWLIWWSLPPELERLLPKLSSVAEMGVNVGVVFANVLHKIAGLLIFGDWDAYYDYLAFSDAGATLVWLDNHGCSAYGVGKPYQLGIDNPPKRIETMPIRAKYIAGVGCGRQAAIALKKICKLK